METFGPHLKRMRTLKGKNLEELAAQTRIDRVYLLALEEEQFNRLPHEVFVRGFLRSYARALDLDESEVFRLFEDAAGQFYGRDDAEERARQAQVLEAHARRRRRIATGAGLAVVLGVAILARGLWSTGAHLVSAPAAPVSGVVAVPSHPSATLAPEPLRLVLEAVELTWVSVRIDQHLTKEVLLRASERVQYEARDLFLVTSGNAGGVRIALNGRPLSPLGRRGEVVRDVRLTRADAKAGP